MMPTRDSQCGFAVAYAVVFAIIVASALAPGCADAQWAWRDAGGHVTYSDIPPPASVPPAQILQQPEASNLPAVPTAATRAKETAQHDSEEEKQFEKWYRKRQQEQKRQQALQAQRHIVCNRLRSQVATLQTLGLQVLQQDPNGGPPAFLSDQQRAAQIQQLQGQIQTTCD